MRFILINQTFHPDVMATGQYLSELAVELVQRGHTVEVIAGRRAYDNPSMRFVGEEIWRGVTIHRVASTGLGKKSKWRRAVDFASFIVTCCVKLLFVRKADVVVALTTPPLISFIGAVYSRLIGARFVYWVMDLNPDEAVAAGWLSETSLLGRTLDWMSCYSFRNAKKIIALDRFMKQRIEAKGIPAERIQVVPPWSLDSTVRFDKAGRDAFRREHGLLEKFVVMYSGNHSPCHPLDTLTAAAKSLVMDERFFFLFVGGGSEQRRVRDFADSNKLTNIKCLPYQPLEKLSDSLSAADLHVVVMGNPFVGIVHPCKIYNILRVHIPVLYIGPESSHVTELMAGLAGSPTMVQSRHGDVNQTCRVIKTVSGQGATRQNANEKHWSESFSRRALLGRLVEVLENC